MPLISDMAVFQRKLATLPLETYQAGETVLSAASTTGRLLILKEGAVAVVKEGVEIARVTEPGAVFGELSVLLDQPHTADVRALEVSQFHVADAATILRVDPIALLYVATVLAQRLDSANRGLLELKRQVQAGEPRSVIGQTVEKIEEMLGATGANLLVVHGTAIQGYGDARMICSMVKDLALDQPLTMDHQNWASRRALASRSSLSTRNHTPMGDFMRD